MAGAVSEDNTIGHVFKTDISREKFEAIVTKACRAPFIIELIAHDPTVIPRVRLYCVDFTTPEDRDRVRIAMRFLEKEQAAALANAARAPQAAGVAARFVSA